MRRLAVGSLHKPKLARKSRLGIVTGVDGALDIVNGGEVGTRFQDIVSKVVAARRQGIRPAGRDGKWSRS